MRYPTDPITTRLNRYGRFNDWTRTPPARPARIERLTIRAPLPRSPQSTWSRLLDLKWRYLRGEIGGPNDGAV